MITRLTFLAECQQLCGMHIERLIVQLCLVLYLNECAANKPAVYMLYYTDITYL